MSFAESIRTCFSKYVEINGRATRSEYWWFALFTALVYAVLVVLVAVVNSVWPLIFLLALILPSLAVSIRRLHDTSRSGWWYLLSIVPFCSLVLLVFFCLDSHGDNQYGPNPKAQAHSV
jgi:uncharacterized membrane protein YhaH (DUF805 family)